MSSLTSRSKAEIYIELA